MKLLRRLQLRLVLTLVAVATVASAIATAWMGYLFLGQAVGYMSISMQEAARGPLGDECRAESREFHRTLDSGIEFDGYDADAFASGVHLTHLDEALASRLRSGERSAARLHLQGPIGGVSMLRVSDQGPCAVLQFRWPMQNRLRWLHVGALGVFAGIVAGAAWLVTSVVVLRGPSNRFRLLHGAAQAVGLEGSYRVEHVARPADDELAEVHRALDAAHARILSDAAAIRARERALAGFLVDVAHDLKTPIAALQLALEEANQRSASRELEHALELTVYLTALLDNLRASARLGEDSGQRLTYFLVELGPIVERVARRLAPIARGHQVELHASIPDDPVWVATEPTLLEQALMNVAHNAVVHQRGGHASVLLTSSVNTFELVVSDDGPGVAEEQLSRLTERGFRGSTEAAGSGLGLAIVAQIGARLGFTLAISRREPRGLEVRLAGPTTDPGVASHGGAVETPGSGVS